MIFNLPVSISVVPACQEILHYLQDLIMSGCCTITNHLLHIVKNWRGEICIEYFTSPLSYTLAVCSIRLAWKLGDICTCQVFSCTFNTRVHFELFHLYVHHFVPMMSTEANWKVDFHLWNHLWSYFWKVICEIIILLCVPFSMLCLIWIHNYKQHLFLFFHIIHSVTKI